LREHGAKAETAPLALIAALLATAFGFNGRASDTLIETLMIKALHE
jgi:hypothetical protein